MAYDVIGDIHGCYDEFVSLTKKLGYNWEEEVPVHPGNRKLVFVGDLTDRGPQSVKTMETVIALVKKGLAYYVPGNHCDKLYRYFLGRNVQITHGLETTVAELEALDKKSYAKISDEFRQLVEDAPLYLELDDGQLIVAHAGIRGDYIGRHDKKVKTFVLYGDITGEKNEDGTPVRRDWAKHYKNDAWIIYGHTPVKIPRKINYTINIDTGCVFGGQLTACRYPEIETVSVDSSLPLVEEKFRSFDK
ncbi:bis(5'-nucleosyl)-tetraphosphatase PrpE [Desertibacillus haloalkaliphilus]|uniref:bis(5'-nucleosyl)-tetraphosphatase PrpE n=1 Tax=Desertibacillus haloalkaliphilus TaxID=1328930 RepID=UPI001C263838|nr:bis(5'-nucleosyl)-tetraphosphatase PrpE [Desertibacillus haloalkaliphilus]MBU8906898.1 bis(5'-nucleosyl)-tetraphosphatase PrpE [Desertibacillus haloalkaliphilus]